MNRDEMENCVMKVLGLPRDSPRVRRVLNLAQEMTAGEENVDFIAFFDVLVEGNVLAESRVMAVTNLFRLVDVDRSGALIMSEVKAILYAAVGMSPPPPLSLPPPLPLPLSLSLPGLSHRFRACSTTSAMTRVFNHRRCDQSNDNNMVASTRPF